MPRLPRGSSATYSHYQRAREVQLGDKAQNESGEDLPQPRGVSEVGYGPTIETSEEWVTGRRYLDIEQLKEHRRCYEER
jgi:hypothetical protein